MLAKKTLAAALQENKEVVGGLLGLDKYFFKREEVVVGEGDANNFTEFKLYRYAKRVANLPDDWDGVMAVFIYTQPGINDPVVVQVAFTQSNRIYHRIKWYSGEWFKWVEALPTMLIP